MRFPAIPYSADPVMAEYLSGLHREIDREMRQKVSDGSPVNALLLRSPDRSLWTVEVADDGTLSATKVQG